MTQTDVLSNFNDTDIEAWIKQYPFVSSLHMLLSLKQKNKEHHITQIQKTLLLSQSPFITLHHIHTNQTTLTNPYTQDLKEPTSNTITIQENTTIHHNSSGEQNTKNNIQEETNQEYIDESNQIQQTIVQQLAIAQKPVENTSLSFNELPQYAIDYFMSQGIIADEDISYTDKKFNTQVFSFLEWLHKQKNFNFSLLPIDPLEIVAQKIAADSNIEKEVVTESMAIILAKQGKKNKAIILYKKLSLLFPEKSSYFAKQIHSLESSL